MALRSPLIPSESASLTVPPNIIETIDAAYEIVINKLNRLGCRHSTIKYALGACVFIGTILACVSGPGMRQSPDYDYAWGGPETMRTIFGSSLGAIGPSALGLYALSKSQPIATFGMLDEKEKIAVNTALSPKKPFDDSTSLEFIQHRLFGKRHAMAQRLQQAPNMGPQSEMKSANSY